MKNSFMVTGGGAKKGTEMTAYEWPLFSTIHNEEVLYIMNLVVLTQHCYSLIKIIQIIKKNTPVLFCCLFSGVWG